MNVSINEVIMIMKNKIDYRKKVVLMEKINTEHNVKLVMNILSRWRRRDSGDGKRVMVTDN